MAEAVVPKGCYVAGYTNSEIKELPAIIGRIEVSRLIRVSERTVVREASKGRIDGAFRVGKLWRFGTDAVCKQFGLPRD